ncbi:MAG: hypothetical protein ACLRV9_09790 [Clostridium sp.]
MYCFKAGDPLSFENSPRLYSFSCGMDRTGKEGIKAGAFVPAVYVL